MSDKTETPQDPWKGVKAWEIYDGEHPPYWVYDGRKVDTARAQREAQHAEMVKALKFACHDAVLRVADRALECDQLRSERDIAHSNHMNALALSGDWKQRADAAEAERDALQVALSPESKLTGPALVALAEAYRADSGLVEKLAAERDAAVYEVQRLREALARQGLPLANELDNAIRYNASSVD
jgi:cytochrome c551/c552